MEFPGDRSHSTQFIVTEESIRFWACPWDELDANSSGKSSATKKLRRFRFAPYQPAESVRKQWLVWSLLSVAYVGTISLTGFAVHEAVSTPGAPPSQNLVGGQLF
ncbi:MAG: hypothetical protein AAF685_15945 [Cyanobacteria bacterium P01_C01_bin.89]